MRISLALLALICIHPEFARATIWTVSIPPDTTGNFYTIQSAIDSPEVLSGDIIELSDGTYVGNGNRNIDFGGKALTVRSASDDPEACVIDCEDNRDTRAFIFQNAEDPGTSAVQGITIMRGNIDIQG